jgi:DNA-binding NtrC family response regulator
MMPDQNRTENRILFVDDEPSIVATLPRVLREFGFDVIAVSTVPDAINAIKTRNFDLLLCDLNINAMRDGFDVVDAIRAKDPRCPVVILTGYPDWQSAVRAIHHRVDDYVVKPADTDNLVRKLKRSIAARLQPKARILSVSNDEPLLLTRHMLLQHEGYEVVSTIGMEASLKECHHGGFDVFILGHSIPDSDKQKMVEAFRATSTAPIISLQRNIGQLMDGADYHVMPDPESLLQLLNEIVRSKGEG